MPLYGIPPCVCDDDEDESEVAVPSQRDPLTPKALLHPGRIVEFKGTPFINARALELYEDYYDHAVGDVISVQGPGGGTIFFELAGHVSARKDTDFETGYMLVRVDPEAELRDLPVLDVNPEDAVLLGKEEEDPGGDEAR